jgi:hypothetical protein
MSAREARAAAAAAAAAAVAATPQAAPVDAAPAAVAPAPVVVEEPSPAAEPLQFSGPAISTEPLPDIALSVHTLQVEPLLLRQVQQARQHVWVSIDPLGLADELNLRLRSRRFRLASTDPVFLGVQELLPIEPGEPLWEPVCEALRSVEEQDSDVYFVLKAGLGSEHPDELDAAAEGPGLHVGAALGAAVGALRAAAVADDSEEELGTARM